MCQFSGFPTSFSVFKKNSQRTVHVGKVIAGAIGTERPHYDIWGDTVNLAARMYQTGSIDKIQITKSAYDILLDLGEFELEERPGGPIEVKGKGKMQTYYLTGPMPNAPPIDN